MIRRAGHIWIAGRYISLIKVRYEEQILTARVDKMLGAEDKMLAICRPNKICGWDIIKRV